MRSASRDQVAAVVGGKLEVRQGVEKLPPPEKGKSRDQAGRAHDHGQDQQADQ